MFDTRHKRVNDKNYRIMASSATVLQPILVTMLLRYDILDGADNKTVSQVVYHKEEAAIATLVSML